MLRLVVNGLQEETAPDEPALLGLSELVRDLSRGLDALAKSIEVEASLRVR